MEITSEDDFNYESYLLYNPDLRHLDFDGALNHWKTYGLYEKRLVKPIEFDYPFYVRYYPDIKHMNYDQALKHYKNHGLGEGRLGCRQILDKSNNIVVVIHLFHLDLAKEMSGYVDDVKHVFKNVRVLVSVNENISAREMEFVSNTFRNAIVFKVPNGSNKKNLKSNIEKIFKVNVTKINIINKNSRIKLTRGKKNKVSGYKKAIITLKKGQSIDLTTGI